MGLVLIKQLLYGR